MFNLTQEQVKRFYETLGKIIGEREGLDIKLVSIVSRNEEQHEDTQIKES